MTTVSRALLLIGSALVIYIERRSVIVIYSKHRADDVLDMSEKQSHTGPDLRPSPPLSYWVAR